MTTHTTPQLTEYVVGFALDNHGRVALIRKNRPEWQAGRLNGIGGHVEPGETPAHAMAREFHEETGRQVGGWSLFVTMDFPGARIYFYRVRVGTAILDGLRTTTDETVCVLPANDLGQVGVIPNLSWLVPLAAYTADTYEPIHVSAAMTEAITPPTAGLAARGGDTTDTLRAAIDRVEHMASVLDGLGTTSVYESAAEIAAEIRAAINGDAAPAPTDNQPTEDAEDAEDAEFRAALARKWLDASEAARKLEHHWPADCLAEAAHMLTSAPAEDHTTDTHRSEETRNG